MTDRDEKDFLERRRKMKIGIGEGSFKRWGDERFQKIKECGYDCVDYGLAGTDAFLYHCDEAELVAILSRERRLIKEAGLSVSQIHGPWRWPPQDRTKEEQEERMEKMKKAVRCAALLGCKNMVIHPMMPYGIEERDTPDAEKTWEFNLAYMRELLAYAKEQGVTICLENMPMGRFSMGSALDVLKFVKEINDENFKICLDTGHVAIYDQGNPAEMVRALKDEIRVLHVHDNDGYRDIHQMPYFGVIDWEDFGRALSEIGYDGVFNFETAPPGKMPDATFKEMCKILVKVANEIIGVV